MTIIDLVVVLPLDSTCFCFLLYMALNPTESVSSTCQIVWFLGHFSLIFGLLLWVNSLFFKCALRSETQFGAFTGCFILKIYSIFHSFVLLPVWLNLLWADSFKNRSGTCSVQKPTGELILGGFLTCCRAPHGTTSVVKISRAAGTWHRRASGIFWLEGIYGGHQTVVTIQPQI